MTTPFTIDASQLLRPIVVVSLGALALLLALALRTPHLARIGVRNAPRRPLRAALIVFGLTLATMFVAASLAVDDTITQAVRSVAVYNLGRIDEDVTADGRQGFYSADEGLVIARALAHDRSVAGVAPALVTQGMLVTDNTSRQARGGVNGLAMDTTSAGPLGDLRVAAGQPGAGQAAPVTALGPHEVYLNSNAAALLVARPGDALYLYSSAWAGRRYAFTVRAVVSGGAQGSIPEVTLALPTLQAMLGAQGQINHIYVANAGDGLAGVNASDTIADHIYSAMMEQLDVHTVKLDGVRFALRAQDIFGRILTLYTLFTLAIGLLLIFLIFTLLAAERRAELGMVRTLGMRREHIVRLLLFEGGAYDMVAAAIGVLTGLGLGALIVALVGPTLKHIGFPLQVSVQPQSMVVAFCIGLLFTLVVIWLAAWTVSRVTITAALNDLDEPPAPSLTLAELTRMAMDATLGRGARRGQALGRWGALLWGVTARGVVPLLAGWAVTRASIARENALLFSLGLSLLLVGALLLARWAALTLTVVALRVRWRGQPALALRLALRAGLVADRLTCLAIGLGLALYWALPFDALASLGLPRFSGGIESFFVAGVMMVFGVVWALAPNLDLALAPVRWALASLGRARHVTRLALVYPAQHRFRTGVGLALFSLVCFTMVVMACIAASTTSGYDNLPADAAGYDIAGQALFTTVGSVTQLTTHVRQGDAGAAAGLDAVSSATPLPLGIVQPGAQNARWSLYPVTQAQGAFLDGVGLPLVARAQGYSDDAAVWRAVRTQPGAVVIDAGALSARDTQALGLTAPPGFSYNQIVGPPIAAGAPGLSSLEALGSGSLAQDIRSGKYPLLSALASSPYSLGELTLRLQGVASGRGVIAPTTLWAADLRGGTAIKLHVVGVVENARGQRYGLFGSPQTFAPTERDLPPFGNDYYYFKVKAGVDTHGEAQALGSALANNGFETTVLGDVLLDANGPRIFISRVLVGLVGLTLLVGMAALAVTGSRAVVERRQQIGMLRALGFRRTDVQALFLIESLLVGVVGTVIGMSLGLILCRNVFAVNFFEPVQSGLVFAPPWRTLAVICGAATLASTLAALAPAWQAGRVTPADALRYE